MRWGLPFFAAMLTIVLAVWFAPSIFGGKAFLPLDLLWQHPPNTPPAGITGVHNYLIGDMLYENYTWKLWRNRCLAAGELPLWNPAAFCGHPLLTTGQASVFYPLDFPFLILPLPYAYAAFLFLHLWLGGVFQYLFLRRLGVNGFGSAVGGITFALCGFFTMRMVFPMLLGSGIWLPLMLLCLLRLSESENRRQAAARIAVGAAVFAMPFLAGFFEIAFYAYIAAGLFTLARAGHLGLATRSWRRAAAFCTQASATVVLAIMLTGPQLLPFLEVKDANLRTAETDYKWTVGQALRAEDLLVALAPDIVGNPARRTAWDLRERRTVPIHTRTGQDNYYFGTKNYVEIGCYVGLLPLLLAPLSLGIRGRHRMFLWFLLAFSLCLAFATPLYAVFYHAVPGFKQVRTPFRWLYLSVFAVTSLAAIGGEYWFGRLTRPSGRGGRILGTALVLVPAVFVAVLLALLIWPAQACRFAERAMAAMPRLLSTFPDAWALAGFMWANAMRFAAFALIGAAVLSLGWLRRWGAGGAAAASLACFGVLAADAGLAGYGFNTQSDPAWLDRVPPSVKPMQADAGVFRIARFGPNKVLYPNLPTVYGLQDVGGYDSIILTDYVTYLRAIEPQYMLIYNIVLGFNRVKSLDSPLFALLNIRYLITTDRIEHPRWKLVSEEGMRVYRTDRELPRAFLVHEMKPADSLNEALDRMKAADFDPRRTAVIVDAPRDLAGAFAAATTTQSAPGDVRITRYGYSAVDLATKAQQAGIVILCDMMYPGWRAYVDDQPVDVLKADGIFRGAFVPAGEHRVSFRFEPACMRHGWMLLGAALAILAALLVLPRLRPTPGRGETEPNPPPQAARQAAGQQDTRATE